METAVSVKKEQMSLQVFYDGTSKFIELHLDNVGKLSLADVKALEPNIIALKLIKGESCRLYKPQNGYFEEPKEKWSSFKVFAVLNDSTNDSASNALAATVKSDPDAVPSTPAYSSSEPPMKRMKMEPDNENVDVSLSSSSLQPLNNTGSSTTCVSSDANLLSEVTDDEVYAAYNVQHKYKNKAHHSLKVLLCGGKNPMYHECFCILFNHLKRVMITQRSNEIVKKFWSAFHSDTPVKTLDSNAPDNCELCSQAFTFSHLVSKDHILKYQSRFNKDPPELSVLFNAENGAHLTSAAASLKETGESQYDYFTNEFYPKPGFRKLKGYLISRTIKANLTLPSKDPMFIEKLIFLKKHVRDHPTLHQIFPAQYFCKDCNINITDCQRVFGHIASDVHFRSSLNQDELNKLFEATSAMDGSADGIGFTTGSSVRKGKKRQK